MDAVSQIQNYVSTIATLFATTAHQLHTQSEPVTLGQVGAFDETPSKEKATRIFQRLRDVDLLMAALPERFASEEEQLAEIKALQEESDEAGRRLFAAREEALRCQQELLQVLGDVAEAQFGAQTS